MTQSAEGGKDWRRRWATVVSLCLWSASGLSGRADAQDDAAANRAAASEVTYQVTGLFNAARERDLKEVFSRISEVRLVRVDVAQAEATLALDAAQAFPGAKPEQVIERIDQLVRGASRYTFGIKARRELPLDKLQRIEIAVVGLDCRACELAVYEMVYRLPGVEMATASFPERRLVVYVRPGESDRASIEKLLRERGVELLMPPGP